MTLPEEPVIFFCVKPRVTG